MNDPGTELRWNEGDRIAALERYEILDTNRELAFEEIAQLAADIFDAPVAVVNLVADGRQWFKAEVGIGARELSLDVSICRHVLLQRDLMVVPNLREDPRFACNPLVAVPDGLRFYAGALLVTPEGFPLGTVCVLDREPRPAGATERQVRALKALASQTMAQLEIRRSQAAIRDSEARLRFLDRLAEATQPLVEADAVMATTARLLGEHLNLSVCAYADMDEDEDGFTIRGDWAAPGATSIVGRYRLADFGRLAVEKLGAGLPFVVDDNLLQLAPEEAATFQAIGIAATICMPLVKAGRLAALMAIHDSVPRKWKETELSLLREVTARSWAHVERVAAVAELRGSESRLRAVFDQAAAGFARTDLTGRFTEVNDRYCTIVGRSREELLTLRMQDLTHPDDLTGNVPPFEALGVGGPSFEIEKRYLRPDGSTVWVRNSVSAVSSADGAADGVLAVSIDLTQKRLAEARLRESEARFRAMADASPALVWVNDASGACEFVSAEYLRFFGKSMDEVTGFGWVPSSHPEDGETYLSSYLAAVEARAPFQGQARFLDAAGEYRWLESTGAPRFGADGAYLGHVGLSLDITHRKVAEAALEESEARLRAVVDAAPIGLVFADESGRITGGNARVEEILGRPILHSAAVEDYGGDYVAFHADGRRVESDDYPLAEVLGGEAERAELEVQIELPNGSLRWVRYIATLVKNELGRTMGAVVASLDIDREKRFAESLAREVDAAVAELEAAQEALRQSQKLEAIGQLTGGVAHDFNNLLTVIRGSVDLLRRGDLSDEKRARYVDAIGDTADRAAKLTGQLLAFARRQALSADLFDAGVSLEEVATMLQTMTGSRIQLELHVPTEPYFIVADRSQFDTAIVNMGINARDAMGGEGRLTISTGPVSGIPAIRGHAAVAGDFVAVTVTDTGSGITPDQLGRIFEPFFTTKGVGEGTGLGLSQVIGFAKQSGGDVRVDSTPGEGTTFTLYLPRAYPDEAAASREKLDAEPVDGRGARVLVVEDNENVGRFARAALEELGYQSTLASDARAALAMLEADANRFDILFSDVVMPGMGGVELGQEIRHLYPSMPVILTSGYSHILAENGRHGFELLHKPYSVEQLSRVLRKAVAWRLAR
jgi:PAS domain S-box-containing protein